MHCTIVMFTMSFDNSVKCKVIDRGGRDLSKNEGLKLNLHKPFIYFPGF